MNREGRATSHMYMPVTLPWPSNLPISSSRQFSWYKLSVDFPILSRPNQTQVCAPSNTFTDLGSPSPARLSLCPVFRVSLGAAQAPEEKPEAGPHGGAH